MRYQAVFLDAGLEFRQFLRQFDAHVSDRIARDQNSRHHQYDGQDGEDKRPVDDTGRGYGGVRVAHEGLVR